MRGISRFLDKHFDPQFFSVLREGYTFHLLFGDLVAGIIVGIVALPLAIAFAIASGVSPEHGLHTAIIAGFLISFFGGSRVQIGGPTGAFIVVVYAIIQNPTLGYHGLLAATVLAGLLLIAMGLTGLGSLIKYIPYPVILGFTSGIAVIIATSQIQPFLGLYLEGEKLPAAFVEKLIMFFNHCHTLNYWAVGLTVLALAIIFLTPKVTHRIPGTLIAVLLCTAVVSLFALPVDTIGQQAGQPPIPLEMKLPAMTIPQFTWSQTDDIVRAAMVIAMLCAIESLLSAIVADGMIGTKHRSNTELVAQGIANVATPFFGGIPATGAIARTATNVRNGGRTPVAGIIHAFVLLLILICFGKYTSMIPMAALAGILLSVAISMSEYRLFFRMLYKAPKSDMSVMLITFFLTVFLDLTVAIPVGLVLASLLFMRRMKNEFMTNMIEHDLYTFSNDDPSEDPLALRLFDIPEGVLVYEVNGPFFFGAANKFQKAIEGNAARVVIFRMRNVPFMDATGANVVEEYLLRAQKTQTTILFSGVRPQPMSVMNKFGLIDRIGPDHFHHTIVEALPYAADIVEKELHQEKNIAFNK